MLKTCTPKIIHYCWFGNARKSREVLYCISSWKKHFLDYKIIEWNENNYFSENAFYRYALENKLWAFASDYARLDLLYNFGGIYFDTDYLVLRPFSDILSKGVNLGAENVNFLNAAFISAHPKQLFIKNILKEYESLIIKTNTIELSKITIPKIITQVLFEKYIEKQLFNKIIETSEIKIFPPDYFYPLPFENRLEKKKFKKFTTENSVGVHLWSASWSNFTALYYFKKKHLFKGILKFVIEMASGYIKFNKSTINKHLKAYLDKT